MPLIMAFAIGSTASAKYSSTELCLIPWGEGHDQLRIEEPHYEDSEAGIEYLMPTGGPSQGFVGMNDVIYISSNNPGYFKAFNNDGSLAMDIQPDSSQDGKIIYLSSVNSVYVDSLYRIYLESFPQMQYISVLDQNGNFIGRLNPFAPDSGINISSMKYHSLDVLTFDCWNRGFYTYMNDKFVEGGSFGWRAGDGYYYHVAAYDSTAIMFKKYSDPNLNGIANWRDTTFVNYHGRLKNAGLLGIDDSLNIYVRFIDSDSIRQGIQIYNNEYELIDELIMPVYENKFMWYMQTFIRRDGAIYEFRCLDDGLHVIKWIKQ